MNSDYAMVFFDVEYTGVHQFTSLVSIGMATLEGEELLVTFRDFDQKQVTPWLAENVLPLLDQSNSVSYLDGLNQIESFLESYAAGRRICMVSAGKSLDLTLLFELWHTRHPELEYFHCMHYLPDMLNHLGHFDLNTMFALMGVEPPSDREPFVGRVTGSSRHEALHDARIVRECYLKMAEDGLLDRALPWMRPEIGKD